MCTFLIGGDIMKTKINPLEYLKADKEFQKIPEFLKGAFCIDGDCKFITDMIVIEALQKCTMAFFKLTDSKRGDFYIGIYREQIK